MCNPIGREVTVPLVTRADTHNVSSSSIGAIGDLTGDSSDPFTGVQVLQAKVAFAAATKLLEIQRAMGAEVVALLQPDLGTKFDRRV